MTFFVDGKLIIIFTKFFQDRQIFFDTKRNHCANSIIFSEMAKCFHLFKEK